MIRKQLKLNLISVYTLISAVILSFAWYYGAGTVLANIEFFKTAPKIGPQALAAVNGFSVFVDGASSFYVAAAAFLLFGLFFSGSFLYEKSSGFGNTCIIRSGFKKYYRRKLISVFLFAFLTAALVLTAIFAFCLIRYSAKSPSDLFNADMVNEKISVFFTAHPYLLSFAVIFTISIQAGLFTLFGLCCSVFLQNRFVAGIAPFALFLICTILPQFFKVDSRPGHAFAWIYPAYFSEFFVNNDFSYTTLPLPAVYLLHLLIAILPCLVLAVLLYRKNRREYIK